jgi:hypothetical protein
MTKLSFLGETAVIEEGGKGLNMKTGAQRDFSQTERNRSHKV